jgi:GTPase SAR1 family protein
MEHKKICVLGDAGIGKTKVIRELVGDVNPDQEYTYYPTLGVEVSPFRNLGIWELAGDDRYQGSRSNYLLNSTIRVIVTNGSSVSKWVDLCNDLNYTYEIVSIDNLFDYLSNLANH